MKARGAVAARRLDQAAAQLGIAGEPRVALGRREIAQLAPRRMGGEGMGGGLQPHDHADRPRADLRVGGAALRAHAMHLVERLAPQLGLRHRPAPAGTESGRPASLAAASSASNSPGPKSELTCSTPRAGAPHALGQREQLGLAGAERGREAAVACALCLVVREVVTPSAPARSASSTSRVISSRSPWFGTSAWSAPRSPMT